MIDNQSENNSIEKLASLLDTQFKGPFGTRFGLDGVIGLIPGVGDFITNILSLYIVGHATAKGYPKILLFRMVLNIAIENLVDAIPLFGNVFDFFWKSNSKNVELIRKYNSSPEKAKKRSTLYVAIILLISFLFLLGLILFAFFLMLAMIEWIAGSF